MPHKFPQMIIQNVPLRWKTFDTHAKLSSAEPSPKTMLTVIHKFSSCFHRHIFFPYIIENTFQEDLEGLFKWTFYE